MVSAINVLQEDDINDGILHVGTNAGYFQFNTASGTISNELHLTSQDPAIVNVRGISQNPINNDVALALIDGIAIYDGTNLTKYTYNNSDLTIGENEGYTGLDVKYGALGDLYIFIKGVLGYQKYSNGSFETEVATSFRFEDIEENMDGTKTYFAGWNTGVHMLNNNTMALTNFTTSNSDLLSNTTNSLHRDKDGNMFIGHNLGINKIDIDNNWSSLQGLIEGTTFPYPVFKIDSNDDGDLVVNSSKANSSYSGGICNVDTENNIWTNFKDDGINCIGENIFRDVAFVHTPEGGRIAGASAEFFGGDHAFIFNPASPTDSCSSLDFQFIYNGTSIDLSFSQNFATRIRSNGDIEVAFVGFSEIRSWVFNPDTFDGTLPPSNSISSPATGPFYDIISRGDLFISEDSDGISIWDEANNRTEIPHNIPDYYTTRIKVPDLDNPEDDTFSLIHKGNNNGDVKLFRSECNVGSSPFSCTPSVELLATQTQGVGNVDFEFAATRRPDNSKTQIGVATFVPTPNEIFGAEFSPSFELPGSSQLNGPFDEDYSPIDEPIVFHIDSNPEQFFAYINGQNSLNVLNKNPENDEVVKTTWNEDQDGDGEDDKLIKIKQTSLTSEQEKLVANVLLYALSRLGKPNGELRKIEAHVVGIGNLGSFRTTTTSNSIPISGTQLDNHLPEDFFVYNFDLVQYETDKAFLVMLTNYGFLFKTNVDVSQLNSLSTDDYGLQVQEIHLYPNPSSSIVTIKTNQFKSVKLFDLNGRIVLSSEKEKIDISQLAIGVYIAKVKLENNLEVSKKLVVQ